MKRSIKFNIIITTIAVGLLVISSHVVTAQSTTGTDNGSQALEISPPVITLSAKPGQVIKAKVKLRDISKGKLLVTNQINDFIADGENGTPKILLNEDECSPYSIKDWITPLPNLLLNPREIKNLVITINVPENASPGGYYGIIRFTGTPPELEGTGVSLQASLGSLLLIRVEGKVKENITVESFTTNYFSKDSTKDGKPDWLFESTPISFIVRLKNNGNIHEQPNGQIIIKDMFGKKIGAINVNLYNPPKNILPQSIRKFTQNLDKGVIGDKKLFGRYDAELKLTYGDNKDIITSKLSFWVIPYRLIILIILILIGGFIILRQIIKRYNKHIIYKAQKQNIK